jgi:hypothetical protein
MDRLLAKRFVCFKSTLFLFENQGHSFYQGHIRRIWLFSLIFWQEQAEKLAGIKGAIGPQGSHRWK